ncbi:helix-turn-helix transcriptional regulator [Jiangella endophytica]|uniref:helix-turn-helix transcriptional regulator n=1 Tax=Jiangella endophytica TaxID=1623398 RepID=UPI000E343975|nr:LuxR family transcriptional regulator [Jiangella endophytica]
MLEAAGVTAVEEQVYGALVDWPADTAAAIATLLGLSFDETTAVLASLEAKGLMSRTADRTPRFLATPPDIAIEPLILQRQAELQETRRAVDELLRRYRASRRPREAAELVEVVVGRPAVAQRFQQLQRRAEREVLVLVKPPFAIPHEANDTELDLLARGVTARAVYERSVLESDGGSAAVARYVAAGEQARVVDELPVKFALIDGSEAFVPLTPDDPETEPTFMVVHRSGLLAALIALFESLWERAFELSALTAHPPGRPSRLTPADAQLMSLLLAGLTDKAIAGQLGLSIRTVHRRISALLDRAQVSTRLQLGWYAAQHGWLDGYGPAAGPPGARGGAE